jgi:hypothetical protein
MVLEPTDRSYRLLADPTRAPKEACIDRSTRLYHITAHTHLAGNEFIANDMTRASCSASRVRWAAAAYSVGVDSGRYDASCSGVGCTRSIVRTTVSMTSATSAHATVISPSNPCLEMLDSPQPWSGQHMCECRIGYRVEKNSQSDTTHLCRYPPPSAFVPMSNQFLQADLINQAIISLTIRMATQLTVSDGYPCSLQGSSPRS